MLKEKFQTVQAEFIPLITQLQKHFLDSVFSTKLGNSLVKYLWLEPMIIFHDRIIGSLAE
jgi:hypothetical protein